ncbi:MAG: family 78 glycoside hydrolase catalytic domain [Novosphingobium sp.]|nr:family 78 glycoside hydrolase catalytic domain [Novosphingobium sp.]
MSAYQVPPPGSGLHPGRFLLVAGALLLASAAPPASGPTALEVEYTPAPLGLDEPAPRLAWRSPVAKQSAYRIQVASSVNGFARALVWDSGKVTSDANVQIPYAGLPLASRRRYWWRVMVWDEAGRGGPWSAPGWWEMGLLAPGDWNAQWIAGREPLAHDWRDLTLDAELTLTGQSVDVLFRAQPHGKTYGDAYVWTLSDDTLVESVRRYPGGSSSAVKVDVLKRVPLAAPLRGKRHRLTIAATGSHIVTRLDGREIDTLVDTAQARGTVGFAAGEARAAVIHSLSVTGTGSAAFRTDFAGGDNPFTGGEVGRDGLQVAAGVPKVDLVLPIEAPAPLVRRSFAVPAKRIAKARLYYAGAGMPRLLVNGTQVGSPLGAGFTAYDKRVLAYTLDVTRLLRPGENVVGAELGRGWYGITDPNEWYFHAAPWHGEPALKAQLEISYADGTRDTIATGPGWTTVAGPTRGDSLHRGERYDARLLPLGWDRPGFAVKWPVAQIVTGPAGRLVAANSELVEPVDTIAPVAAKQVAPTVWVYDFGRIIAGRPVLSVRGPRGTTVTMVASERIAADGRAVPAAGLVDAQLQTDHYTLTGGRLEQWEPSFGYRGFRYVEVQGYPATPGPGALKARIVHSAVARTGGFASADPLLGRIDAAATATILNNLHGFQTDTPTYEKNGWTGDAQASAGAAARSLGIARVWTKWLADFADAQAPSGEVPEIVPATPDYGYESSPGWAVLWGPTTPWDAAALILPWELYRTDGDTRILARSHAMQKRLVDYTASFIKPPEFRRSAGLSEWASAGGMDFTNARGGGIDAVTTAYFYLEADLLARSSEVIGEAADAAQYRALAEAIRAAYNARYWDDANGWYRTVDAKGVAGPATQVQNVLPLAFGMVPSGREQGVADAIARDVEKQGLRTGVYGTRYLLEILSDHGHADLAYRLATNASEPGWAWWLANGHSTLFETWSLESRSRDHHYFASIADWMRQRLAGLRPGAPGYKQVLVKPAIPAGLAWAEATMATVQGPASARWQVEGGRLTLTAEIPPNAGGEVWVPTRFGRIVAPAGAEPLREESGHAVYRTGAGRFEFHTGGTP